MKLNDIIYTFTNEKTYTVLFWPQPIIGYGYKIYLTGGFVSLARVEDQGVISGQPTVNIALELLLNSTTYKTHG